MEYLSLYDYLNTPAGMELGLEVKKYADENDIPTKTREISNPKYQGKVILYPKDFLDLYFRKPFDEEIDDPFDDLPF